ITPQSQDQWVLTLDSYANDGFKKVEGWVDARLLPILKLLHQTQTEMAVQGGVLEIGVHHGRFFLPLNAMVEPAEGPSFAIDLFEDQALNIDRSGHGSSGKFAESLRLFDRHGGANVHTIAGDSTRLRHGDPTRFRATPPKVISVDGGHTVEHTLSDLQFAEAILHDRGAVFLDDILNAHWVGVFEGAVTYLQRRPTLWPVFIGYNKLILVPMSVHGSYLASLRKHLPGGKLVALCGYSLLAPAA
ncbi:class I SAM-dependent methyltransferase, partial [Pseudotabrizicola sediminis]